MTYGASITGVPTAVTVCALIGWPNTAIPGTFAGTGDAMAVGFALLWPAMGPGGEDASTPLALVMSWMLDRLRSRLMELSRMKYF